MILDLMTEARSTRLQRIDALPAQIDCVTAPPRAESLRFVIEELDSLLTNGGLCSAALHEVAASAPTLAEDDATTLFLAGIASRCSRLGSSALWAVTRFEQTTQDTM